MKKTTLLLIILLCCGFFYSAELRAASGYDLNKAGISLLVSGIAETVTFSSAFFGAAGYFAYLINLSTKAYGSAFGFISMIIGGITTTITGALLSIAGMVLIAAAKKLNKQAALFKNSALNGRQYSFYYKKIYGLKKHECCQGLNYNFVF